MENPQEVWQCFDNLYEKFNSLDFGTPLSVDLFCCICGRFLVFGYEDTDPDHKCRFCKKCWDTIKNSSFCPDTEHETRMLSTKSMALKLINQYPVDVLILCPYKCKNLYTVIELWKHQSRCKNGPKEIIQEKRIYEVQPSPQTPYLDTARTHQTSSTNQIPHPSEDDHKNYPLVSKDYLSSGEPVKTGLVPLVPVDVSKRQTSSLPQSRREFAGTTNVPTKHDDSDSRRDDQEYERAYNQH